MVRFPESARMVIRRLLGRDVQLSGVSPVSGGSINETYRLDTSEGPFFLKRKRRAPAGFFACEARGLGQLRQAGAKVPAVIGWIDAGSPDAEELAAAGDDSAFLLMEWLEKAPWSSRTMEDLGRGLAAVHRSATVQRQGEDHARDHARQKEEAGYGLHGDNFIGELAQPNRFMDDWAEFYGQFRLKPQWELGLRNGTIAPGSDRARRLEYVIRHVDRWIPRRPGVSVLHGDLWAGNAMAARGAGDADPAPYLLDPSAYFGHHEVDLAFSEYFGGFSPSFYSAYREVFPWDESYRERKPLYQLYYILVHLNLFGEAYGADADAILRRYAP
jgi:fructosamine-3-kinase